MAKRAAELEVYRRRFELSSRRRRLNVNVSSTSSNTTSFKINFSPQACFKNDRGYPAVFGGTQFCGPGHFCNVANFVNTSNLTNATSPMSTQPRSLREPILSPSDGGINGNTGGWMPRRRLLSSTTTSSQTITTTISTSKIPLITIRTRFHFHPSPSPTKLSCALFIRSKPGYPGSDLPRYI